jgi:hypothetical protein
MGTTIRRALSRRFSVGAMIEIALILAIPHVLIGIGWGVFHPDYQTQRAKQLYDILPPGVNSELVTFGETALWWPVLVMLPSDLCTRADG